MACTKRAALALSMGLLLCMAAVASARPGPARGLRQVSRACSHEQLGLAWLAAPGWMHASGTVITNDLLPHAALSAGHPRFRRLQGHLAGL